MAYAPSAPPPGGGAFFAVAQPPPVRAMVVVSPPPGVGPGPGPDARLARLAALAAAHEIRSDWVPRLRRLEDFDIAVICDDSGSMATAVAGGGPGGAAPGGAFAPRETRWTELRRTVSIVLDLAAALSDRGVDVHFLNRPPVLRARSAREVQVAFDHAPPAGYTPLTRALGAVLGARAAERPLLLLIATDGQPTDDRGNVDVPRFVGALRAKREDVYVQILACTDDDAAIAYLADVDRNVPRVDVTDDFASERAEVRRAKGARFAFSFGDYVVKALLGPVDPIMDTLDHAEGGPACCAVV